MGITRYNAKNCRAVQIKLNQIVEKMSIWSLIKAYWRLRYHSNKHFSELPTRWRKTSTDIDTEQNYVTFTFFLSNSVKISPFWAASHASPWNCTDAGYCYRRCVVSVCVWVALLPSVPSTHHSHHPPPLHSFVPGLKPFFLQILPTIAFLFFFRTHATHSLHYLPILLNISAFTF